MHTHKGKQNGSGRRHDEHDEHMTLLSGVCRQLHVETALLPQRLNAWSFADSRAMERFLHERRLTLTQRRAMRVLFCREGNSPSRAVERRFGNLEFILVVHDREGGRRSNLLPWLDLGSY